MQEAKSYAIAGFFVVLAVVAFIVLLSRRHTADSGYPADKVDLSTSATAGGVKATACIHIGKSLDIDVAIVIFAFIVGAAVISRVVHYLLSFFSKERIEPYMATVATLYWIGFAFIAAGVLMLCLDALIAVIGEGEHESVTDVIAIVLTLVPLAYVLMIILVTMIEWPRRLYALRAVFFYPILFMALAGMGSMSAGSASDTSFGCADKSSSKGAAAPEK
jgi:hypothetical protein